MDKLLQKMPRKYILSEEKLPYRIKADEAFVELKENVQFCYRNFRLKLSQEEWGFLRAAMHHLGMSVEKTANEYEYGEGRQDTRLKINFDEKMDTEPKYNANTVKIEIGENIISLSYRELQIDMAVEEFEQITKTMILGLKEFRRRNNGDSEEHAKDQKECYV